jgi:hypothetical protein
VGVEWIWRGMLQLVFYRLVYYHLTIDSVAVSNLQDLFVYMLSTFLLYVRISGHFPHHRRDAAPLRVQPARDAPPLLPRQQLHGLLATDQHLLEGLHAEGLLLSGVFQAAPDGRHQALLLATAFTFAVTWFLHLAQWFWIRGSIHLEANDIIFWTVFGCSS